MLEGPAHVPAGISILKAPGKNGVDGRPGDHPQMAQARHRVGQAPVGNAHAHPSLNDDGIVHEIFAWRRAPEGLLCVLSSRTFARAFRALARRGVFRREGKAPLLLFPCAPANPGKKAHRCRANRERGDDAGPGSPAVPGDHRPPCAPARAGPDTPPPETQEFSPGGANRRIVEMIFRPGMHQEVVLKKFHEPDQARGLGGGHGRHLAQLKEHLPESLVITDKSIRYFHSYSIRRLAVHRLCAAS
jgi:hypothetical protein